MTKTVGLVGLGAMGRIIARHLLDSEFSVSGFDIDRPQIDKLQPLGLSPAESPKSVAEVSDIIITSLPSAQALNDVITGDDGLLDCEKSGQILLETSTLAVADKLAACEKLEAAGKIFLDAPISGTTPMLAKMAASMYVSGDEKAYKSCQSVIESFTGSNFHVGQVGDSSKIKYLANYLVFVHTAAAAECMALGQKAGLDPEVIHHVLNQGAGMSRMFEKRGEMMVKSDYRDGDSMVFNIFQKDAAVIKQFAEEMGAPIDLFATACEKFNLAITMGLDHLELAAVCKATESLAGVERKIVE